MATKTIGEIAGEIDAYIRQNGGVYAGWYVGIAADPRKRLFSDHNVREYGDAWIHADAGTEAAARRIEQHFIAKGCKGGGGGGGWLTTSVYAYRTTLSTRE